MLGRFPVCIVCWMERRRWCVAGRWAESWLASSPTSCAVDTSSLHRKLSATPTIPPSCTIYSFVDANAPPPPFQSLPSGLRDAVWTQRSPLTSAGRCWSTAAHWMSQTPHISSWSSDRHATARFSRPLNTVSRHEAEGPSIMGEIERRHFWGGGGCKITCPAKLRTHNGAIKVQEAVQTRRAEQPWCDWGPPPSVRTAPLLVCHFIMRQWEGSVLFCPAYTWHNKNMSSI